MPQQQQPGNPNSKRLPLAIQPENRDDSTLKDAKIINAYVEKGDEQGEYWVYKRPGLAQLGSAQTGAGLGVYNWEGNIYSIFGATLYKNGVALTGALDTTGGIYTFSSCLGTVRKLQFGNGVATYNYDSISGIVEIESLTTVTAGAFVTSIVYTILVPGSTDFTTIGAADSNVGTVFTATGVGTGDGTATTPNNFPSPAVKGIVYLDGTTYVMDSDASIRGCTTLNDPTTWTDLLNRLTAQIEPDGGIALTKQLVYILALGQWSTEVFYDAANPTGSPLSPVQGAKINYGCVSADSIQEMDGVLFWIATNRSAAPQILMLDNLKPVIISTKSIERLLGTADYGTVYSFAIKFEGHRFYGVTLKNENITLVYDSTDKMWEQWTDANGNYWPIVANTFNATYGRVLQHESNGQLYTFEASHLDDAGTLITVDLYTPNFDGGTRKRKHLPLLEFVGDQAEGSVLQVRYNDYDYDPTKWSNFRQVDMGLKKPLLANNGTFLRRAYHIRHQSNTRMRLQAIEMNLELGTL